MNIRKKINIRRRFTSTSVGDNWFALYDDGDSVAFVPVVTWATYEDSDGFSGIIGMIREPEFADLSEADSLPHFRNYMHASEIRASLDKYKDAKNVPAFSGAAN